MQNDWLSPQRLVLFYTGFPASGRIRIPTSGLSLPHTSQDSKDMFSSLPSLPTAFSSGSITHTRLLVQEESKGVALLLQSMMQCSFLVPEPPMSWFHDGADPYMGVQRDPEDATSLLGLMWWDPGMTTPLQRPTSYTNSARSRDRGMRNSMERGNLLS